MVDVMTLDDDGKADLKALIDRLYQEFLPLNAGELASYIPELLQANPALFSICLCTPQGELHAVGDADQPLTIQSISKVFVYGLALEDHGRERLLDRVGVEPTGDAFNAIVLEDSSKRPYNPMVNAGAIATTSLIKGANATDRLKRLLAMIERYVGHDVQVDLPVLLSERSTGYRNRAMAYLLRNFGMVDDPLEESLDLYFQQCSIKITCRDLAIMAATLANQGVNPMTQIRAIEATYVKDILSIMYSCGMYNYAGQWAHQVGLPAKSGVSGGIIAVVPNRLGIAVFSPLLDPRGNSVRGLKVCEALSKALCLHLFDCCAPLI
jgi:glutaminase